MKKSILGRHKIFWLERSFILSVLFGLVLLAVSMLVNHFANTYTSVHASNYVTDLFLDHLPVVDVHLIFSEGAVLFFLVSFGLLLFEPKYIPFALKSVAIFILIRSFFLVLTHLAPPLGELYIDPTDFISQISSGNDLFFSGHTGLPFLFAFIFWEQKGWRYFFMACSFIGGAAVLLGHLHYSIDVFSALFIAFGIFHICKHLFPQDFKRANE